MSKLHHVICCNDSIEYVSGDPEKAEKKLNILANKHWKENQGSIKDSFITTYEDYRDKFYWHVHVVKGD